MLIHRNLPYSEQKTDVRLLDWFVPEGDCRATMVWMHGGGIEGGDRRGFDGIARQLCAVGIGFASVEYSLFPQARYPEFLLDCAAAAAFVHEKCAQNQAQPRVFLGGSSAGAYLAMMLCFARPYLLNAGVSPEDFAGYFFDAGQPTTHFNVLKYRGQDSRRCVVDEAAPLYHICDARPGRPIQILYADDDMPARPEQNEVLRATLQHFGYDMSLVEVEIMRGYSHCGYDNEEANGRWVLADHIERFINRALKIC